MGLRQVANTTTGQTSSRSDNQRIRGCVARLALWALAANVVGALPAGAADPEAARSRIASYRASSGETYFAASIQPSADDAILQATGGSAADVVVIVDTSASQVGGFRTDSIAALRSLVESLKPSDRVRLFAGDVKATDLSGSFSAADTDAVQAAMGQLRKRLPLGNTNLVALIDSVRSALVAEPEHRTRSIVYIGDGASIDATSNQDRFEGLVDALRADRISVHGIAVGPITNIETMAILANHTGGVIGVIGNSDDGKPTVIGRQVGTSARKSPVWISEAKMLEGMRLVHGDRLPPLRLERDSILLGRVGGDPSTGKIELIGETTSSSVRIVSTVNVESSHPDFSFLPGLVDQASENRGLLLASAGSPMLRLTAKMIAARAEELVRVGEIALKQGNKRGAKAIAEKALQVDPDNTDAQSIQKIVGGAQMLVMQNADDPFNDLFSTGGDTAAGDVFAPAEDPAAPAEGAAPAAVEDAVQPGAPAFPPAQAVPPAVSEPPVTSAPPATTPGPAPYVGNPVGDDEILETGGSLLRRVEEQRSAMEGRLRAEVNAQLKAAGVQLRVDPKGVPGQLKSLLSTVETTPDIDPQLRQELVSRVRSAIRSASQQEAEFNDELARIESQAAAAASTARLLESTFRREATLKTLARQLNDLIDQGKYDEADGEVSLEFAKVAGDTITRDSVAGRQFTDEMLMLQVYDRDRRYREMRERNFVDAFSLVLKSNIPFVDEPPIVWPDADVWRRLSDRRLDRYGSIELIGDNETEQRIQKTLGDETSQQFFETPLEEAIQKISQDHDIPIVVDSRALEDIGLTADTPVSLELENVSLRSFMRLMLRELELTYMIKDEVMQITTIEAAEENRVTKVYPVGDLVVPILQLGGAGGAGGGIGGGGGGGIGGGGGGGFGGGGGGGFGGGGGGGFGGGGAFAVPDQVSLREKASGAKTTSKKSVVHAKAIRVQPAEGQTKGEAFEEFFAGVEVNTDEELTTLDQRIRRTAAEMSVKATAAQDAGNSEEAIAHFRDARDLIAAAMRSGHVQPWMYQAYAITLKATDAPDEEVERALLSAVDFAETPEDLLHVAARLEEVGSDAAALKLCRSVSDLDSYRREPYVMGLRIAKRMNDLQGLAWACQGVLSNVWPEKFKPVADEARLVARATYAKLIEEGREEDAKKFNESLQSAASHDAIVRVTWTGDADLDLAVEEPSGTVCSFETMASAGGGTLLGDSFSGSGEDESGAISETYICPKGFSGQYRVLLRRVWGEVSTGNATVEVITDVGRPEQRYIRQEVPLTEKDALLVFEVKKGQRKEEIADAQLAHLQDVQRDLRGQVLAQFAEGPGTGQVLSDLFSDVQRLTGGINSPLAQNQFFPGRRAVGFRPEITTLPEGATVLAIAIISADRRYVRITPSPIFSQVGDVTTFNFVTGEEGAGTGGGGGGGLGGGGFGGGGGGGGVGGAFN